METINDNDNNNNNNYNKINNNDNNDNEYNDYNNNNNNDNYLHLNSTLVHDVIQETTLKIRFIIRCSSVPGKGKPHIKA